MQKKQINDSVSLSILRKGIKKEIALKLTRPIDFERLVPNMRYDVPPTYYIAGGMVFEPLTLNYLVEFGSDWSLNAPAELLDYYMNGEPDRHRRQIIIMVKVLADEINTGYHDSENVVIASVNGRRISDMHDLVQAFEDNKGQYHEIEDIRGFKIVISVDNARKYAGRILDRYGINSDRSVGLKAP